MSNNEKDQKKQVYIPLELRDKITAFYNESKLLSATKGKKFTVNRDMIKRIPELKPYKNMTFLWKTWERSEGDWGGAVELAASIFDIFT